ncbi:tyrosine-type recombinase/integrase [Clostridium sp.]|uniref:tyrosine-type recombinase/integrase n=1 Tax=Clostridium sp. TaxID=1506 RepID=UPI0032174A9D
MYCFTRAWKRFLDRINVDYRKFHALRHTYATKQFEYNSPLKIVSELLCHTDIYITANTYTHVLKEHKEKSIDIFNSIIVKN